MILSLLNNANYKFKITPPKSGGVFYEKLTCYGPVRGIDKSIIQMYSTF